MVFGVVQREFIHDYNVAIATESESRFQRGGRIYGTF